MRLPFLLIMLYSAAAPAEGTRHFVTAVYPGKSWQLRYELDGVLEQYNNHKPGVSTYAFALGGNAGLTVSVQMAPAAGAAGAARCREDELARLKKSKDFGNPQLRFLDAEGAADMEATVDLGDKGVSRHLHRYWLRDGVCAKLHVSKTPFAEADQAVFSKLLGSARFEPAQASVERGFVVPQRGTLLLTSPAAWGFRTGRPGATREIHFLFPDDNHRFMLTVFPQASQILGGEATPRKFVEDAREKARQQAVETDLPLQDLAGRGYYFVVTDKNLANKQPKPEDWKYLTQGALTVGDALLFFSLFSNVKDGAEVQAGLALVRQARFDAAQ